MHLLSGLFSRHARSPQGAVKLFHDLCCKMPSMVQHRVAGLELGSCYEVRAAQGSDDANSWSSFSEPVQGRTSHMPVQRCGQGAEGGCAGRSGSFVFSLPLLVSLFYRTPLFSFIVFLSLSLFFSRGLFPSPFVLPSVSLSFHIATKPRLPLGSLIPFSPTIVTHPYPHFPRRTYHRDVVPAEQYTDNIRLGDTATFLTRWGAMVDELRTRPDVVVVHAHTFPGIASEALAAAEERLGNALHPAIRAFFRESNGLQLLWIRRDSTAFDSAVHQPSNVPAAWHRVQEEYDGRVLIPPLETVLFTDYRGQLYFDFMANGSVPWLDGAEVNQLEFAKALRPLDWGHFYYCFALYLGDSVEVCISSTNQVCRFIFWL